MWRDVQIVPKWEEELDKRRKFAIESDRAFVIDFIREKLKEILSDYASIDDEEFESKWRLE